MPMKPDITNASDALWSAAVERERVIATLATASQVSRSEVEGGRCADRRRWRSGGHRGDGPRATTGYWTG
jgi:hypothetical protein